jgi:hypothetical protein
MGQVISSASISLDGYIAKADNTIGHLFDWLQNGDVEFPTASPDITLHLSAPSATYLNQWITGLECPCLRPYAVRLHRGVGRQAHAGCAGGRSDSPGTPATRHYLYS